MHAQKISWDKIIDNGVRNIGAESISIKIDKTNYDFSLAVFSGSLSKEYCLLISSIWEIEDNCVVIIKLGNKEEVKLVATHVDVRQIDSPTYMPIIGGSPDIEIRDASSPAMGDTPIGQVGGIPIGGTPDRAITITRNLDYFTSHYFIDDELVDKIERYGISKMKIASGSTFKEKSWCRNKLGKYSKKSHKKLEEQLLKPSEPAK